MFFKEDSISSVFVDAMPPNSEGNADGCCGFVVQMLHSLGGEGETDKEKLCQWSRRQHLA